MKRSPSNRSVGVQPTRPTGSRGSHGPTSYADGRTAHQTHKRAQENVRARQAHTTIYTSRVDAFVQQHQENHQEVLNEQAPISQSSLVSQVFQTSDVKPASMEAYSPDDPRAQPLMVIPGATGGFLPPPPI